MTTVPMINLKNSLAFKPFFKGYVKRQLAWNGFIEKIFEPFTKTHIPERDQSFSTVRAQNFLNFKILDWIRIDKVVSKDGKVQTLNFGPISLIRTLKTSSKFNT